MKKLQNEIEFIKVRNNVTLDLENLLSAKNYLKVEPDYFESYDWFLKTNTRQNPSSLVKLIGPNGKVQLLRPDITTNIMKQLSPYWDNASRLKLYYNATTFRQSQSAIIQSRQFGIESLGDATFQSEVDIIKLIIDIFEGFQSSFILTIGNQKFLETLFMEYDEKTKLAIKKALIKKDEVSYKTLISSNKNEMVQSLFECNGTIQELQEKLRSFKETPIIKEYFHFFSRIKNGLTEKELKYINFDLGLLPEFDYYSGIVFQGCLERLSKPLLYGGRYDKLTKEYGVEIPAVGVSFDLTAYIKEVQNDSFVYCIANR